ncbi:hypothetical protein S7711_09986 [Stachybotrys chartarum IBT 7711]|uniref:ATP-grasp domain-containing protein n=1 Tax=Stachybotrys chartarum (strain CBS 109288 / IBT 7711) TaxID=1280523 RepID=A0A084AYV6_STACB|nr:hypothetical protein S7711_09986 [Stachybotrys chartarum IBT 7711]
MADTKAGLLSCGIRLQSDKCNLHAILIPCWSGALPPSPASGCWSLDFHFISANEAFDLPGVSFITLDDSELSEYPVQYRRLLTADLSAALASSKGQDCVNVLRLLFAVSPGTPIRSDYIEYRLRDAPTIHSVRSFLDPLAPTTGSRIASTDGPGSLKLLRQSLGGLIGQGDSLESTIQALNSEIDFRLSVPWLAPTPSPPRTKRILWVQGRANIVCSEQFYLAAQALGIIIVVADAPGHWMQDPAGPHAHLREAFVELNIDADVGLAQRIVDVVQAYPERIDGIVTISDSRLLHVARACEVLGLPTEKSDAYEIACDKGATRRLVECENGKGEESFVLEEAGELEAELVEREDSLRFPMIVKPRAGWNSDCVQRVEDTAELRAAIWRASKRHAASALESKGVVVEPYIDGPEVDADMAILDGEVLFCYITDDFPCSGDLGRGISGLNFQETVMDVPSALPEDEQAILRDSLPKTIQQCGFASGVFHCEARVKGSRLHYRSREDNGILDLHPKDEGIQEQQEPSCYLHEINARPPGYANTVAALLAHGVDYYAIRLLLALGYRREEEKQRIRALARPFRGAEPQYTSCIAVLPPTREGIMASENCVLDFLEANPDLKKHVVWFETVKGKGDTVQGPDSSELWMLGNVIVASRNGRKEAVEIAYSLRKRFDYKLLEDET